jgi:23S rRNA (guanine745-N1)-methyltransferase
VAPLSPRPGHRLLRCPICRIGLDAAPGALVCRNRHSFDLAREGYVNLLPGNRRRPAEGGDRLDQLRHRAAFLEAGHFDFITAAIRSRLQQIAALPPDRSWRVLDAGSGTGHHLARIAAELGPPVVGLGLDIAAAAARRAARRWPGLAFAVADLWADWPVHDAALDLVISIFAPKNFAETARVLRPGGRLAAVYPGPNHLAELGRRYGLMRHHQRKARRYAGAAGRMIGPSTTVQLARRTFLDPAAMRDAVLMGPDARHIARQCSTTRRRRLQSPSISMSCSRASGEQGRLKIVLAAVKVGPVPWHLKGARNRR